MKLSQRIYKLFDGLTMRTVLRFKAAGLMHSLIYIGFLGLFAGTVTLEIHHLMPPSLKFLQGTTYIVYSFTLELATIAYLTGLFWALARRLIGTEYRIKTKTTIDDYLTLSLLIFIGISGITTEAGRIALENFPDYEKWSFIGYAVGQFLNLSNPELFS